MLNFRGRMLVHIEVHEQSDIWLPSLLKGWMVNTLAWKFTTAMYIFYLNVEISEYKKKMVNFNVFGVSCVCHLLYTFISTYVNVNWCVCVCVCVIYYYIISLDDIGINHFLTYHIGTSWSQPSVREETALHAIAQWSASTTATRDWCHEQILLSSWIPANLLFLYCHLPFQNIT